MPWTDDFVWVPDVTPISAGNFNKMNAGIREAHAEAQRAMGHLSVAMGTTSGSFVSSPITWSGVSSSFVIPEDGNYLALCSAAAMATVVGERQITFRVLRPDGFEQTLVTSKINFETINVHKTFPTMASPQAFIAGTYKAAVLLGASVAANTTDLASIALLPLT